MGLAQTVRWGLWGSGRISHQVAQDLHLVPAARIAAIGSRRLTAARQLADAHGVGTAVDTLAQLIDQREVDAVYIATPDACHRDDVLAVLTAGKPVLCEKPLAVSLADVQTLVDAAGRRQVFLMEAMWTRFLPAIREVKRRVDAGEIGDIRFMRGSFGYADARRDHHPYSTLAQAMLYDRGIYLIALAQYLQPGDAVRASARGMHWRQRDMARALCHFDLQLAGGALLEGVCGNGADLANGFEIVGSRGTIAIPGPFFKAHDFSVSRVPAVSAAAVAPPRRDSSASSWLPHVKRLKRQWQPLHAALRALRPSPFNFPGNGYQFQFEEVARCLAAGRTQSDTMGWGDSLALARALSLASQSYEGILAP